MKSEEQSLLEEYFEEEAIVNGPLEEYKIHAQVYQVRSCEMIDESDEFSWMAKEFGTIKYCGFYFIPQ